VLGKKYKRNFLNVKINTGHKTPKKGRDNSPVILGEIWEGQVSCGSAFQTYNSVSLEKWFPER
jgi:hypothetical protein